LLLEEDFKIVRKHIPDLTKDEFEGWIAHYIRTEPHMVHRMSVQAFHGRGIDIEESNQSLMGRRRQLGIPCPENEKLLNEVKARREQQRQKFPD
jgi:ketopantoate reductase